MTMEQSEEYIFPVEHSLEMILAFDRSGIIVYANTAARNKLKFDDDLCGRHIHAVFPNEFKETEDGFETEVTVGDAVQEFVAYRKNLTCFPVEAKVLNDGARPDLYICMANDVLEKKILGREIEKVKTEAQQAMKVKSEFVANVTHELRTPVNGVLGNVRELLAEHPEGKTEKSLRLIERCCDDMNKIINNILDFSKLEAGKFTLETRKFNFRNMLDYVKGNHINKLTEKGLGFFMTVSPQIPEYVIGDELRIVQVLNNLLSNAQKFTSLGRITVEVLKTAQVNDRIELFFIVSDTGIGISETDKDKLFQSFSQVDASISRKYGGTGLGLNICKQLVELMDGRIEVESEKNKGSTFSFSVWVGSCGDEAAAVLAAQPEESMEEEAGEDFTAVRMYGTPENIDSLKRNLSKLILCVEMENWEKAEMFMETIRQLTEDAPHEIKRIALRLKMAIQKSDYEKVTVQFKELSDSL